ncbi:MAG: excinuclease ABC subunit UvrC [Deltaproteobacteria bacterium]|nr:excinuclease ABC subunit UvrC [Deltaproteobacteria bacterium]
MNQTGRNSIEMEPKSLRLVLPDDPGVYLFKDRPGRVIYVGKAKNIKKRVLSYFRPAAELTPKTVMMMKKAKALNYILTTTENEAFILESSLIKRHMPRYNIILRDDKQYPCLRLSIRDRYPRLSIVRRIRKDKALYFGPFSSASSVRSTLRLIDRIFQLRKCRCSALPKRSRPCLNYQLGRCLGPCTHDIPAKDYKQIVDQVRLFLDSRNQELIRHLKKEMKHCSDLLNFEEAARIRNQISAVERTLERQHVVFPKLEDMDFIGLAQEDGLFQLVILFVRNGYLLGSQDYLIKDRAGSTSEVLEAFLKQHYHNERFIPRHILLSETIGEIKSITGWLSELANRKITIRRPLRGAKLRLIRMAVSNAEDLLSRSAEPLKEDLMTLAKSVLKLKKIPRHMEGLDISNLHGNMAVGSVVSFTEGQPRRSGYRNYRIKTVEDIDDYGMMSEVVRRRLSRDDPPDLFVVDGGKGHLMAVKRVMDSLPGTELPELVAIAKADERAPDRADKIYIPGRKNPLSLKKDHPVLFLLMRIRDEAHRRAITYHRRLRDKGLKESRLDRIPGIGPKRKRLLLRHFGDIAAVSRAGVEELALVPGISLSLAKDISSFFSENMKKGAGLEDRLEDRG